MTTPLASISEVESQQNNKYLVVNQAIRTLEALALGSIENFTTSVPPVSPTEGDLYIVAPTGTGLWSGLDNQIVQYYASSWLVYKPFDGFIILDKSTSLWLKYDGSGWVVLPSDVYPTKAITLPYTLQLGDLQKELVVNNQTGVLFIPDSLTSNGFPDYWNCRVSLDGTGDITIQRASGGTTDLLFSGGNTNTHLNTQNTIAIRHRTSNIVRVVGSLSS